MSHPPIPPGCEFFMDGGFIAPSALFRHEHTICRIEGDLDRNPRWRKLIAAVARCAWMDEAERLQELMREIKAKIGVSQFQELDDAHTRAMQNAAAWAEWGRQGKAKFPTP